MNLWWKFPLVLLLIPFSAVYALAAALRNRLYDLGLLRSYPAGAKVVSVGNLTVGGTGKTPLVEALARFYSDMGHRVAVVSRGYGRSGKKTLVVSDGKTVLEDSSVTGDEPLMLARRLSGVPVLVGPDRVAASRKAVESFGSTLILLDDGFQHRRIKRDMDVVVMRSGHPFGNGFVLPAGPLREPKKSLARADVIVLTGAEHGRVSGSGLRSGSGKFLEEFESGGRPVLPADYKPVGWRRYRDEESFRPGFFRGKTVFAFSGIGNPASFEATLAGLGVKLADHRVFRDHHPYTPGEWSGIHRRAEALGAVAVVTTEKDAARSGLSWESSVPLYYLIIRLEIAGGRETMNRVFGRIAES
jgi:tetraacyldisaccharide 4'-kinase